MAAPVVGALSGSLDKSRVGLRPFFERSVGILELIEVQRGKEPIELLFLVANLVLLDDDVTSKVLQ